MKTILFIEKIRNKLKNWYRKKVFKEIISCTHNDFSLVGDVWVINRNIKLGRNVTIYPGCMFWGDGIIKIGDNVDIGKDTIIYSTAENGGVYIGDNTVIAANNYIIDMDHGTKIDELISKQPNSVEKVIIGKDCWLAANVTVLKGSIIGDGAIIGAKSLVKGYVEPNSIVVGVPCKKIKMRNFVQEK